MRCYAAVPIKSPRGANIGVISVYNQEPGPEGEDLSSNGSRALCEASCAITQHMELQLATDGLRRNERMVRGLGSFVEGNSGMAFSERIDNVASFEDAGAEGSINARQQFLQRKATDDDLATQEFWNKIKSPESPSQSPASYFSQQTRAPSMANSPPLSMSSVPQAMPSVTGPSTGSIITLGSDTSEDPFSGVKTIFSKAANVIR
ncbi:hypothetical protein Micbo1qcDRAFT_169634, partial [Microdochium bolleyi]